MRALIVTDQWSPDVVGGSARVAADTARALARRGHEIVVLTVATEGLARVGSEDGVEVHRAMRRGLVPQTVADPVLARRFGRRLACKGIDVAISHQATVGAGIAALDVPHVAVFHASAVLEMRFIRERSRRSRRGVALGLDPLLTVLERRWLRSTRQHLVLSEFSAGLLRERHPDLAGRAVVVGGGVDESFFRSPPRSREAVRGGLGIGSRTLLFTARRLEPRMGIDILLEALALLRDDSLVLAIAGDGGERSSLEGHARALGLSDRVFFLGRVDESELRSLYAASDVFVMPSVAYEGFGMSTVEALAQGTPALGTAVGATPEILGPLDPGLVVRDASADALAEGIRAIVPKLGPGLRARVAAYARGRYLWDVAIGRWEQALDHAVPLTRRDA